MPLHPRSRRRHKCLGIQLAVKGPKACCTRGSHDNFCSNDGVARSISQDHRTKVSRSYVAKVSAQSRRDLATRCQLRPFATLAFPGQSELLAGGGTGMCSSKSQYSALVCLLLADKLALERLILSS